MTLAAIALFSFLQSLFGIGLLIFGTPTLLLLGHGFAETLAMLLPASLAISLLQVREVPGESRAFTLQFVLWCLLPLAGALALTLSLNRNVRMEPVVALALCGFVGLRLFSATGETVRGWVDGHTRSWLVFMGLVHGVSNLGGGLLAILAAARYRHKNDIRRMIAFCYAAFAAIQLLVLAILAPAEFGRHQLGYAAVAAGVFLVAGRRVFAKMPTLLFDRLLTLLLAVYAALLGLRWAGTI